MAGTVLESVDRHTRLAGHNRVAMLLFRLGDAQLYAINVFKVREVLRRPRLERMPGACELLAGSCDHRGQTIPVIDLAAALGHAPLRADPSAHLLVTEFSRSVQGFLVAAPQSIVHCNGESLAAPTAALGFGPRVSAMTRVDGALVAVVDVEHVLAGLDEAPAVLSESLQQAAIDRPLSSRRVLVADDSQVARRRVTDFFRQIGIECLVANDGREALDRLLELAGRPAQEGVNLVVSDIEMPRMDGYTLTRAIRGTPALRQLKVLLHSSLSGVFNESMVKNVGADRFVAKFQPDVLARAVLELLPD